MAGNQFERLNRRIKVNHLVTAANGYVTAVAGGNRDDRLVVLRRLLDGLTGRAQVIDADPWEALIDWCGCAGVKVNYPSQDTKSDVIEALLRQLERERLYARQPQRVFAGLGVVS